MSTHYLNIREPLRLDRPMRICALNWRAAFYVDFHAAAYIIRKYDESRNRVPPDIREIMDAGQFDAFAAMGELPGDYHDVEMAFVILNLWKIPAVRTRHAYVNVKTEFGAMSRGDGIDLTTQDETLVYIPSRRAPQLFRPAYNNPDELLDEFREMLGTALPDEFDYWKNICGIMGTHAVLDDGK